MNMDCQKCDFQEDVHRNTMMNTEIESCPKAKQFLDNASLLYKTVNEVKGIKIISICTAIICLVIAFFILMLGNSSAPWIGPVVYGISFLLITPRVGEYFARKTLRTINGRPFFVTGSNGITIECLLSDSFYGGSVFNKGKYTSVISNGTFRTNYF